MWFWLRQIREITIEEYIKQTVRKLRKNQTKAEAILWQALRNRQLDGKKFLRQHPIQFVWEGRKRFFVADFYCHEHLLVVEADGKIHDRQKDYDELRTVIINTKGIRVIRFTNENVEHRLSEVLSEIREYF